MRDIDNENLNFNVPTDEDIDNESLNFNVPTDEDICHTHKEHSVSLRQTRRKRRSPAFEYCRVIKKKKYEYCFCKKPDYGQIYWQCRECLLWFHPECMQRDEDDSTEPILCEKWLNAFI